MGVDPTKGASVTDYTLSDGRQVFRTPAAEDPFSVASLPMVPWCNRIAGGVTTPHGFHVIPPNVPGQECPLHGSGFQAEWMVEHQSTDRVVTSLRSNAPMPFDYKATQEIILKGAALTIKLCVTHMGEAPLPYGLGLHPWFPRSPSTTLQARSLYYQGVDDSMLPTGDVPIDERPEWNFSGGSVLPSGLIDTCFGGWDGQAVLSWPDRGLALTVETGPLASWYQVYSPAPDCGFFCFEPVSHPIDAHNTPGSPGLSVLQQGQTTALTVTFRPADL